MKDRFHNPFNPSNANQPAEGGQHESGESEDVPDIENICHATCGGLCERSTMIGAISKLVHVFATTIADKAFQPGHLFMFKSASASILAFLGMCWKRPRLHILVEAHVDESTGVVSFMDAESDQPRILTSHELFQSLVSEVQPHVSIECEHWRYDVLYSLSSARIQIGQQGEAFTLDTSKKITTKKPQIKLPFGMKVRKKKVVPRKTKKPSRQQNLQSAKKKSRQKRKRCETESSSSSDSSSVESSDSSSSDSGSLEEGVPISGATSKEERAAKKLQENFDQVKFLHEEITSQEATSSSSCVSSTAASSSSSSKPNTSTPQPKAKGSVAHGKSFFSKELGLSEVGFALSNQSTCFLCKNRIQKGLVRFSWFHSQRKPSAWVHSACLESLISKDGFLLQSRQKLETWKTSTTLEPRLKEAVATTLASLPEAEG